MTDINKKYILLSHDTKAFQGKMLYRIMSIKYFDDVKAGDLGGYIEKEENLSHEGNCWVYHDAIVCDDAVVYENAKISNNASVLGRAKIHGDAKVRHDARVHNAEIYGNVDVCISCEIYRDIKICGDFKLLMPIYEDLIFDKIISKNLSTAEELLFASDSAVNIIDLNIKQN